MMTKKEIGALKKEDILFDKVYGCYMIIAAVENGRYWFFVFERESNFFEDFIFSYSLHTMLETREEVVLQETTCYY